MRTRFAGLAVLTFVGACSPGAGAVDSGPPRDAADVPLPDAALALDAMNTPVDAAPLDVSRTDTVDVAIAPDAGFARFYPAASPFNTPIAPSATVDPNSAAMVRGLTATASTHGFPISVRAWTVPVYFANASTPRVDVQLTASWRAADTLLAVPVPAGAMPDPQGDGHMMVYDTSRDCEYDFWQAARDASGHWSASWGNRLEAEAGGVYPRGNSARASGFALGAGLIRPEEIRDGHIDHALVFSSPFTKDGGPVAPATQSDGRPATEGATPAGALAIPEGARLQLDPAFDVSTLPDAWQRTVARALQVYGMYLADTGGGVTLYAQHAASSAVPYPWPAGDYAPLPTDLLGRFRVLILGPQTASLHDIAPSRCGDFGGVH